MHPRFASIVTALMAIRAFSGCGPVKLLPNPADLPAELDGRKLWNTPHAFVYAREERLAGETEAWINDVDGHIHRAFKGRLEKGLVLVTDLDDPRPVIADYDEVLRLQDAAAPAESAASAPATVLPASASAARSAASRPTREARRKKLAESGMTEAMACQLAIVALDDAALQRIGLPGAPADAAWRMCCPSDRLARKVVGQFAPGAVEKKKGKAFAVMAAPVMPLAAAEAAKAVSLSRDTLAFELWTQRRPGWPAELQIKETRSYMRQRALIYSPLLSMALSIAERQ